VITDGNANTLNSSWDPTGQSLCCGDGNPITSALVPGVSPNCDDGLWQTYAPLGCFTDINNTKSQVMAMVPGVTIFAIGVGPYVNPETLAVIGTIDILFSLIDFGLFYSMLFLFLHCCRRIIHVFNDLCFSISCPSQRS
jgi:hypothetical protein